MEMPAPFMVDAAGEASYGVGLKVTPKKWGIYPESHPRYVWLSEVARAYPVVLDPIVRTVLVANQIFDSLVSSAYPTTNYVNLGLLKTGYGRVLL